MVKASIRPWCLLLSGLLAAAPAAAETVFRHVDEQGNVSFSATPPPPGTALEVEAIEIAPGPTPEQREAAEQRARDLMEETERRRLERAQPRAAMPAERAAAEQELQQALTELDEARVQRDDDWQHVKGRGRFLAPRYFERVEKAEQRVEAARRALQSLR